MVDVIGDQYPISFALGYGIDGSQSGMLTLTAQLPS